MSDPSTTRPDGLNPVSYFVPHRSAGLKLLLVCGLALLMVIPAMLVYGIVQERSAGLDLALREVSETVGGEQTLLGPVLALPYAYAPDPKRPDAVTYEIAIAYPEVGSAVSDVAVSERRRGIHTIPVFDARTRFEASFDLDSLRKSVPANASAIWADARLYVGVSDTRGIKEAFVVKANGNDVEMEPAPLRYLSEGYNRVPPSGVALAGGEIPGLETQAELLRVSADLHLTGARRFAIGAFAKDTRVTLSSNWPDPSFSGGILPESHNAGDSETGFSASWHVPYLARGIVGAGARLDLGEATEAGRRDMAVRFIKGVSPYQSVERALKYAAMFVGFVFLAYFLFEVTSGARAHPAQYVLVGLAQTIFYLMLLAFSERLGFDTAFLIAALMTIGLTAAYAMNVFRSRGYGLRALGILTGIYALIYVLMRAENHALLAGALASFAAIALTMYMTRNVDWYGDQKATA